MSIAKLRGKSANLLQNDSTTTITTNQEQTLQQTKLSIPETSSLLKIESFVPSFTTQRLTRKIHHRIHRSYSTLGSSYLKHLNEHPTKHAHRTHHHKLNNTKQDNNSLISQQLKSSLSNTSSSIAAVAESNKSDSKCNHDELNQSATTSTNGICKVARTQKEQEKLPDRINYDRRGLTAIPLFENEKNLRLLSLQHNLINSFHIPDESSSTQTIADRTNAIANNQLTLVAINQQEKENITINSISKTNQSIHKHSHTRSGYIINNNATRTTTTNNIKLSPSIPNNTTVSTLPSNSLSPILNGRNIISILDPLATTAAGTNNQNLQNLLQIQNQLLKSSFLEKSIIVHNVMQNYSNYGTNRNSTLKRSKSFISSYTKHLSNLKSNLQFKCNLNSNSSNLLTTLKQNSFDNSASDVLLVDFNEIDPNSNDLENLKVENALPLLPKYGLTFNNLVFLDLYDNQIEKILNLDGLKSLTVLLLGKNRISDISGLSSVKNTLRVLDLHGNRIISLSNKINCLQELKSLNLAGNQIRQINEKDFAGLLNLKELNLKRNKIKRVYGFNLVSLERLWLCHNDLHKIEDMSALAKAISLQEVTIENNPISGDCVSFLVSYLPNLVMLSQMPITEQVRRAAMAWRKNKELSDSNYSTLTTDVFNNIRREEVISNARTNWELLRTQPTTTGGVVVANTKNQENNHTSTSSSLLSHEDNRKNAKKNLKNNKIKIPKIVREKGDNYGAKNRFCGKDDFQDFFRLPPITHPYSGNSNPSSNDDKTISPHSSGSSLSPNIDSSSSCFSSDNENNKNCANFPNTVKPKERILELKTSEVCEEFINNECYEDFPKKFEYETITVIDETTKYCHQISTIAEKPLVCSETILSNNEIKIESDTAKLSIITSESEIAFGCEMIATQEQSQHQQEIVPEKLMLKNHKANSTASATINITSATNKKHLQNNIIKYQTNKSKMNATNTISNISTGQNSNAASAGSSNKVTNNVNQANSTVPSATTKIVEREREQGGDYLIEICGRYLNIYGMGALRFIDKHWNLEKSNDVHTVNFSYINFNNIATILGRIRTRFPNLEIFAFRETNITCLGQLNALAELQGITGLIIDPEGNSITLKTNWRLYAIYRLSHWGLKTINSIEITQAETELAQNEYMCLSDLVLWSIPETMLQPLLQRLRLDENYTASKLSAKDWLMRADQALKIVISKEALQWKKCASTTTAVNNLAIASESNNTRERGKTHFYIMIENTCNAAEKLQKLEVLWPSMLFDIIRNTLFDYGQMDGYIKKCTAEVFK